MADNYVECGYVEEGYFDGSCGEKDIVKVFGFAQKRVTIEENESVAQIKRSRANHRYGRNAFVFPAKVGNIRGD